MQYTARDFLGFNNCQAVATDADGRCTLVEQSPWGQEGAYFDRIQRRLAVDIPGYALGPVPFRLSKDAVNVITAKKAASIRGRVIDWNGNAVAFGPIWFEYRNECAIETEVRRGPDGSLRVDRIMPGEPFRIRLRFGWPGRAAAQ